MIAAAGENEGIIGEGVDLTLFGKEHTHGSIVLPLWISYRDETFELDIYLWQWQRTNGARIPVDDARIKHVTDGICSTLIAKNRDYGNTWQDDGMAGLSVRMRDKLGRLYNLSDGKQAFVVDEKIEDTLKDLAAYAILGLVYIEGRK